MSISAQRSEIQLGIQDAFVGINGTFDPTGIDFYKIQAPSVSTGIMDDIQNLPLRVGGPLTMDGVFKQGVMFAAAADLLVSPEGSLGVLLKGASSSYAVAADATNTGAYNHTFTFDADGDNIPWLAFRAKIPTNTGYYSETGYDCRVGSVSLNIMNQGLLTSQFQLIGRDFVIGDGSGFTAFNSSFESPNSHLNSTQAVISIKGESTSLVGCTIEMTNGLSGPQEEILIGNPKMRDITVRQKACVIRVFEQWDTPVWRKRLLTNSDSGTTWSNAPYQTVTSGSNLAFKVEATASAMIGSTPDVAQKFTIEADQVVWTLGNQMTLAGGQLIVQEIIGTCVTPTNSSHDYLRATIKNAVAAY